MIGWKVVNNFDGLRKSVAIGGTSSVVYVTEVAVVPNFRCGPLMVWNDLKSAVASWRFFDSDENEVWECEYEPSLDQSKVWRLDYVNSGTIARLKDDWFQDTQNGIFRSNVRLADSVTLTRWINPQEDPDIQ